MSVYKREFADRMAEYGGITKKSAREAAELFIETLMDCLGEGERVMFTGFGSFEVKTVREKKARNMKTGEICAVPEHKGIKFHPCKDLAGRIQKRAEEVDA